MSFFSIYACSTYVRDLSCTLLTKLLLRRSLFPYTTLFRSWPDTKFSYVLAAAFFLLAIVPLRGPLRVRALVWVRWPCTGKFLDRKSTRLNSSHGSISYAVFFLKKIKGHTQSATIKTEVIANVAKGGCYYATRALLLNRSGGSTPGRGTTKIIARDHSTSTLINR